MALTAAEALKVGGGLVIAIGDALEDSETPNEVTKDEIIALLTDTLLKLLSEYSD